MNRLMMLLIAGIIFYASCIKTAPEEADGNQNGPGDCTPLFPDQDVNYDNYVKGIIEKYCTESCHRGGNTPGTGDFTTYSGIKPHTGNIFFFRVIQDNADMPQNNAPLPQSIRDSLNIWIKNCAPEK